MAPAEVLQAAESLRYRDFLIISLSSDRRDVIPDNWIYIHEPGVQVGPHSELQELVASDGARSAQDRLGLEYFVFENDDLWTSPDDELIALATGEIDELGWPSPRD